MSSILVRRANMVTAGSGPVPIDYSTRYFTFKALEAGTFSFSIPSGITTTVTSVSYSLDNGSTWVTTQNDSSDIVITTPTVQAGGKVLWKGMATKYATSTSVHSNFASTGNFVVNGNIMSLLYGDEFATKKSLNSATYAFTALWYSCAKLLSAENLILPATALTTCCYGLMFRECTSLTAVPELPATTLANQCYSHMFRDCTSLTTAPELQATTMTQSCYQYMFAGCTALTTAPELPGTTLKAYCYQNMFDGCSALNYIKCLAPDISATRCTNLWVRDVAATGTFVKPASMSSWTTGTSGIPSGWTVQDAS